MKYISSFLNFIVENDDSFYKKIKYVFKKINEGHFLNDYENTMGKIKKILDKYRIKYKLNEFYPSSKYGSAIFNIKYKGDMYYISVTAREVDNMTSMTDLPYLVSIYFDTNKKDYNPNVWPKSILTEEDLEGYLVDMVQDSTDKAFKKMNESVDGKELPDTLKKCVEYVEEFLNKNNIQYLLTDYIPRSSRFKISLVNYDVYIIGGEFIDEDNGEHVSLLTITDDYDETDVECDNYCGTKKEFEINLYKWLGVDLDKIFKNVNK